MCVSLPAFFPPSPIFISFLILSLSEVTRALRKRYAYESRSTRHCLASGCVSKRIQHAARVVMLLPPFPCSFQKLPLSNFSSLHRLGTGLSLTFPLFVCPEHVSGG
ncbi:hypothetical protein B0T24DRAFT_182580 [Lasiosphaeria ovina]|uniref:Uncharacterized protein n=1 Tax=Lasiosphaeria ovina TaxID=92902 RepID=A0AAE0NEN9_9PEZI|nr:hypothetical protein B0T24DRAFT_182580 [Lasiosphaeria ovina]